MQFFKKALFHFTKLSSPKIGFKKDRRGPMFAMDVLSYHLLYNPAMTIPILFMSHFYKDYITCISVNGICETTLYLFYLLCPPEKSHERAWPSFTEGDTEA